MASQRFECLLPLLIGLVLCGCSGSEAVAPMPPEATVNDEEPVIYAAVLTQKYPASFYVIAAQTSPGGPPVESGSSLDELLRSVATTCRRLSTETTNHYQARNDSSYALAADLNLSSPHVLVTNEELVQVFAKGNGWDAFRSQYPGATGYIRLSRVGLAASLDQALVYVAHSYGNLGADGYFYVLEQTDAGWTVTCDHLVWIS